MSECSFARCFEGGEVLVVLGVLEELSKAADVSGEGNGLGFCKRRGDQVGSALSSRVSGNGDEFFLVEFR